MIPKLKVNEDFLKTVDEQNLQYWKQMAEPVIEYAYFNNTTIPVYSNQADTFVGKDWLFNEFKKTEIDFYGYCPSEESLRHIIFPFKGLGGNFMVTARLIEKNVADCDDGYGCYYNEEGENTDMSYPDYVDEYGHPVTQYEGQVISFTVYILEDYNE